MAIKVMIVDDSNFMRKAIASLLSSDPDIEVVALIKSGEEAVREVSRCKPDVITLDWELPGMNGLATLIKIMKKAPTPVVMFSAYTSKGADLTLEALKEGAIDFLEKPSGAISLDLGKVRDELIGKITMAASAGLSMKEKIVNKEASSGEGDLKKLDCPDKSILFIASSTGGVQALGKIIPFLPGEFPMPVLVVQHMPPLFTKSLATSLDENSSLSVKEAEEGEVLMPGNAYIAPGGWHCRVVNKGVSKVIKLDKEPSNISLKPCADISMNSIASVYGKDSICLILTGMGSDGTEGAASINEHGGRVIAQDEATSTIYGMPRSIVESDLADMVLPLDKIVDQLIKMV